MRLPVLQKLDELAVDPKADVRIKITSPKPNSEYSLDQQLDILIEMRLPEGLRDPDQILFTATSGRRASPYTTNVCRLVKTESDGTRILSPGAKIKLLEPGKIKLLVQAFFNERTDKRGQSATHEFNSSLVEIVAYRGSKRK